MYRLHVSIAHVPTTFTHEINLIYQYWDFWHMLLLGGRGLFVMKIGTIIEGPYIYLKKLVQISWRHHPTSLFPGDVIDFSQRVAKVFAWWSIFSESKMKNPSFCTFIWIHLECHTYGWKYFRSKSTKSTKIQKI